MEIRIAAFNYIRKYQENFCEIVESKIAFWYRPDNSLDLHNTKKILFCNIIEPCQVQILQFKCTWITKHAENGYWNYFGLSGLLNSLSNKVIQIKSFFYKVLFTQLSFPTNIGNYIHSQSKFVFSQNSTICEKYWHFQIFPQLEDNKRYM